MTLFVDASALVAIIQDESDADALTKMMEVDTDRITSGVALWEAGTAIKRDRESTVQEAVDELDRFRIGFNIRTVPIGMAEAIEAFRVDERYGKGTGHPAKLNMGDCFAYACARTNDAHLLYKGNDFARTDMA